MSQHDTCGFSTLAIHAGKIKDAFGALTPPIYQTSTFEFESCQHGGDIFAGKRAGYAYSRTANPTVMAVEQKVAAMEGGEAALATSSGMGAITSLIWSIVSTGDHIVADKTLYGCTYEFLAHHLRRMGVNVDFIDTSDENALKSALKPETKIVYLETPANPNMKITDLRKVSDFVHGHNSAIKVVCDNTFATPYLQNPLREGADAVVHSATKYINGHGDLLAGFVISDAETVMKARMVGVKDMTGSVLAANEAFLIMRGLKTMELRMERHCASAMKIAEFLESCPKIEKVLYPGLKSHVGHEVAARQMHHGFGGMVSFVVSGGKEQAAKFVDSLELCTLAVSLGDAETLIEHPASMTHSTYSPEELADAGIPEGLVRLSVGLDNVEDILADLEKGIQAI